LIKQNFIIILTGLPSSGKTTFADQLKAILEKKFVDLKVKIVDPDIIRNKILPQNFNHEKEQLVRRENLNKIKKLLQNGYIVISDDMNYYSSMRHDIKEIAEELNLKFFIIHISTPLKVCLEWNRIRGSPIPDSVIKKINQKFDNFNKYSWDFPEAVFDLSQGESLKKKIEKLVHHFFINLKPPKNEFLTDLKLENLYWRDNENLDKTTRHIVGKLLQKSRYLHFKHKIIKLRKIFVKNNKNKSLNIQEITNNFKLYLEKNLNIKISEDL